MKNKLENLKTYTLNEKCSRCGTLVISESFNADLTTGEILNCSQCPDSCEFPKINDGYGNLIYAKAYDFCLHCKRPSDYQGLWTPCPKKAN